MPNQETSWTTVPGKTKSKSIVPPKKYSSSNGSAPTMPQAEIKTIKLSDSAFSAMKERLPDDDEKEEKRTTIQSQEKLPAAKPTKSTNGKSSSNSLSLQQVLQNIDIETLKKFDVTKSETETKSLIVEKVSYWFVEQLKDVTSGLQDPTFSKENNSEFPLNQIPVKVRQHFDRVFHNAELKFKAISLCQTGLMQQNADSNRVVAYQILLQYLFRSLDDSQIETFIEKNEKVAQSFKTIPSDKVLRLLWTYGQIQYVHLVTALRIWFQLLFPLIENRTYNKFVIDNFSQIVNRQSSTKKPFPADQRFPIEDFIKLISFLDRPNPALTKELRASLSNSAKTFSDLFQSSSNNLSVYADDYFTEIFPYLADGNFQSQKSQETIEQMILSSMVTKNIVQIWLDTHHSNPLSSSTLLSIIKMNGASIPGLTKAKDLKNLVEKLQAISEENRKLAEHKDFLKTYKNNNLDGFTPRKKPKSSRFPVLKLIFFITVVFLVYRNWLWLTVAADYLLEDHLKHPMAIAVKEQTAVFYEKGKIFQAAAIRFGEKYFRSSIETIQFYGSEFGKIFDQKSKELVKYLEGPGYEKAMRAADEIQKVSTIVFTRTVRFLDALFENGSILTTELVDRSSVYLKKFYIFVEEQTVKFEIGRRFEDFVKYLKTIDFSDWKKKFDELRLRLMKSF